MTKIGERRNCCSTITAPVYVSVRLNNAAQPTILAKPPAKFALRLAPIKTLSGIASIRLFYVRLACVPKQI